MADIRTVQELPGHNDVRTTMIYLRPLSECSALQNPARVKRSIMQFPHIALLGVFYGYFFQYVVIFPCESMKEL